MLIVLRRQIKRSLRKRGLWGSVFFSLRAAYNIAWGRTPAGRRARHIRECIDKDFDLLHNVDTAGRISLGQLSIDAENWEYGNAYQPITPDEFHEMMQAAGDVAAGRVFVDFGCGKGRAILLASGYLFKRIVGVEFASELAEVACKNLQSYHNPCQVCRDLEVVLKDAALYPIPDDPLVLFFFNPFGMEIMTSVVRNVYRSLAHNPRPVTVIYNTPEHDELWAKVPSLRRTISTGGYSIYHSQCHFHCLYGPGGQ